MTAIALVPPAIHVGRDDQPFVDVGGGNKMKVVFIDEAQGLFIVETIFKAGMTSLPHRHTNPVFAYTMSGAWKYLEYDYVNRAGSFLFEPAGSVHTLTCLEDDTHVWFQMYGANLNLDPAGNIVSVTDGPETLQRYYDLCDAQGLPRPTVATAASAVSI